MTKPDIFIQRDSHRKTSFNRLTTGYQGHLWHTKSPRWAVFPTVNHTNVSYYHVISV